MSSMSRELRGSVRCLNCVFSLGQRFATENGSASLLLQLAVIVAKVASHTSCGCILAVGHNLPMITITLSAVPPPRAVTQRER